MRAATYRTYGPPEVLRIEDLEQPAPGDGEVLVAVHAAAVNPLDWKMRRNFWPVRAVSQIGKPVVRRVGADYAGVVAAVGAGVSDFEPGEAVFGYSRGACAEYLTVPESKIAGKPANVSFAEAAAVPVAGLTALQGLRDSGGIRSGQEVLVYGASGGVGHLAVQIANAFGATVDAVCSGPNRDWVGALGARAVIDYTTEDFTRRGQGYDLVFDTVGYVTFARCRSCLKEGGVFVTANFLKQWPDLIQFPLARLFGSRKARTFITRGNRADLEFLAELMADGRLRPHIERSYDLAQIVEAHRHAERGHTRGKIVIGVRSA
jgi:NADPH:quinone reductase-like Zn-dependent oxidoreductase